MAKLLSIAIPTKNRQEYLIPLLKLFLTFDLSEIEVVIQDNSDDESIITGFLEQNPDAAFKYYHKNGRYSQMENSEFALENCKGKYICFLGDDDYLSRYLIDYVRFMDRYSIECSAFCKANYLWKGVSHNNYILPDLIIRKFKGMIRPVSVKKEFQKLIKHGAISLFCTPQVYHCVLLKSKLEAIKGQTGVYIPGPSPDMALATSLCSVVNSMVLCDVPYITSGKSIKSAGGLGIKHEHKGQLGKIEMLPTNIEERWLVEVPKIWTGPTIYAQSCNEALRAMKLRKAEEEFNWNYFYAFFFISFKEYNDYLVEAKKKNKHYNGVKYNLNIIKAFAEKCIEYINIKMRTRFNSITKNELMSSFEAGQYTDDLISKINLYSMFDKYEKEYVKK